MKHLPSSRAFGRALSASLLFSPTFVAVSYAQAPAAPPLSIANFDFETLPGKPGGDAKLAPGLNGQSLILSGTGAIELTQKLDTAKSFTVMAWVKLNRIAGFQTFLSSDGPNNSAFYLQLRDDTHRFALNMLPNGPEAGGQAGATEEARPNEWYHLAGVFDAAKKTVSLYVNGVWQESVPFELAYTSPGPLRVGRAKYNGAAVDFVAGQIDDAQVFQSALTGPQVLAIAQPLLATAAAQAPAPLVLAPVVPASLAIDVSKARGAVSPLLYGLMTEEINHAFDGGLYAELIRNRTFQDDANAPVAWSMTTGGGVGAMALDTANPFSAARSTSLKLQITDAKNGRVGVQNEGYWGIPIHAKTKYSASFWARVDPNWRGPISLSLESADGTVSYGSAKVKVASGITGTAWKKYEATISTKNVAPTTSGRFVLAGQNPGTLWLSHVSLFPPTYKNRKNGFRVDLMEKMAAMKPKFLRFPGGNYLEGNTIAERFDWKKTLGPIENRPGHRGPWNYRSTDGMGLAEFLGWCDDLEMEPLLGVYAGYSLGGEHVTGAQLQPFVQEALDEIEYLIGDKNTVWGARRVADGRAAPFKLRYVEIGNEDFFDKSNSYDSRFAQFYDAIKAKYPALQLISTTMDGANLVKSRRPDVIDEHYYLNAREMEKRTAFYDKYDRNGPKIFVGEWAAHTERVPWQDPQQLNAPTPNLGAALGDAAFMTGMERNSDIVVMQCYAPLFVNVNPGGRQWAPNLIGYDNSVSFGAPSYYAQVMFAGNVGDTILDANVTGGSRLASSVTRGSKTGQVFVKIVNSSETAQPIAMSIAGARGLETAGTLTTLKGNSATDTNSLALPTKVVPVKTKIAGIGPTFSFVAPPFSISVLELKTAG